ncbi:MAG: sensor histidine kinase [Ruminiclostridium sp.]|nr:sensor histidine kinase [Ruminiclostridium sp.]
MHRLTEKCALLFICLPAFAMSAEPAAPVIILLAAVAVSTAVQLFSGKPAAWVMIAVISALCGFFPLILCAIPMFFYDALCEKKWWLITPAAAFIAHPEQLQTGQYLTVSAGVAAALIIYLRISQLEKEVRTLRSLRDDITGKNMQLSEQNLRLAAAQDNEVHIATLKERNRIAREIHDNVGHLLTRSILQTGALQIINKDETLKEPLSDLKNTLDGAMTSIRASVHDLHDDSIDLKRTITEMTESVSGKFDVTLNFDAGEHIPGEIKLCAAGIVKEGLSNAVKHSDGSRIDIVFREHPGFYQLLIKDNGKAGTVRKNSRGIGLKNMEDRAESVGGRITFSGDSDGFRIFMTIPKGR